MRMRLIYRTLVALFALLSVLVLSIGIWLWRHADDEWTVPVRTGHIGISIPASTGLRLLTHPTIARFVDGHRFKLPIGTVTTRWDAISKTQHFHCAPCRIPARGFGSEAMSLAFLDVSMQRENSILRGDITAGEVAGTWQGVLTQNGLELVVDVPRTAISALYELFHADIPELAVGGYRVTLMRTWSDVFRHLLGRFKHTSIYSRLLGWARKHCVVSRLCHLAL